MQRTLVSNRWIYSPLTLALAAVTALIWGFWDLPLYDLDEGAFTEATREMIASGNYVSITLNGEPRHDKPILIYWLQAAAVHLFGLNEFALRLPSILAGLAWLLAVVRFARRHIGADTGYAAGLIMVLSLYVGVIVKGAVADALLHVFLALGFFEIYNYFIAPRRATFYRAFLWMGLGFLTKGPVAVVFPLVVSLILFGSYGRWGDWARAVFNPGGVSIFLAIIVPWHVAVYLDSGWAFFEGFYLHHNLNRYSGAMEGHYGSYLYYLLWTPLLALPFTGSVAAHLGNAAEYQTGSPGSISLALVRRGVVVFLFLRDQVAALSSLWLFADLHPAGALPRSLEKPLVGLSAANGSTGVTGAAAQADGVRRRAGGSPL